MTPERWSEVERIYCQVLDAPAGRRGLVLAEACAGDEDLRREVESLVAADEAAGAFLGSPALEVAAQDLAVDGALPEHQRLGGYEIVSRLGSGGMGEVYTARDMRLGRLVALKVLSGAFASNRERVRRFSQEARAASALNHPNIVTIYELGESDAGPFIAMELVPGFTLRDRLETPIPVADGLAWGAQVARALAVAHAAGIVHRDIKPENIMVRSDGLVKMLDFGLARLSDKDEFASRVETVEGAVMGTVRYMSPEQSRGAEVGPPSDIFSLGIVLYEILTGQHPFEAESRANVLEAIQTAPPIPPSRLNPHLGAGCDVLLGQMLSKDARRRPGASDVEQALTRIAAGQEWMPRQAAPRPVTVGRAGQRQTLRAGFDSAAAGRSLILTVAGEAGIGKTTLVEDFLAGLAEAGEPFHVARGRCSERLAGAEAYLPVLEALDSLMRAEGEPIAKAMGTLAPRWFEQVAWQEKGASPAMVADAIPASQERIKRELASFLEEVTRSKPLVVFLDDVQWADVSTIDLLGYLAGRFDKMRLLTVITYRPSELALAGHPFLKVKPDLQARGLCREVALEFLTRADVEEYLSLEFPGHAFTPEFAAMIYSKTEGSPLFMSDVVRYLRDRGVVARRGEVWKVAQAVPEIERELPESVRGMIERKIAQLTEEERRLLTVASVQGYQFDSAVVAGAAGIDPAEVEERLERLERVHAFVRVVDERELPDRTVTLVLRFVHVLYQNAFFAGLRATRKAQVSSAVARALVAHYGDRSREVASELAYLFESAREPLKAAEYFRYAALHAGEIFASQEALGFARRGLEVLRLLPESPERNGQELALQTMLGAILIATEGYSSAKVRDAYLRARTLCEQLGDTASELPVLYGLIVNHLVRARYIETLTQGREFLAVARRRGDPASVVGHRVVGVAQLFLGELEDAQRELELSVNGYAPGQHRALTWLYGGEPGMVGRFYLAWTYWLRGWPDRALTESEKALELMREVAHAHSKAYALAGAALLHQYRREPARVASLTSELIPFAKEQGLLLWLAWGTILRGWAMTKLGQAPIGIEMIRRSVEAAEAAEAEVWLPYSYGLLAEAYGEVGQADAGMQAVERAEAMIAKNGERYWAADLRRVKAELLRMQGAAPGEVEEAYQEAIAIARRQGARSLELRATASLARVLNESGRRALARGLLKSVYRTFTEGLDTPELAEAKKLLEALEEG